MTPQFDQMGLLAKILADTPKLPDAACIEFPGLHDPAHDGEPVAEVASRHAAAEDVCLDCPAMVACAQWADTQRPYAGVIAGRIPPVKHRGRPTAPEKRSA